MQISRLESEFSSYKVRAHALLQKKESEISAARDNELIRAHEEAVKVQVFLLRTIIIHDNFFTEINFLIFFIFSLGS